MSPAEELTIGVLLPDVLGTYSDAGNAVVLAHRALARGAGARIRHITADTVPPTSCDIYLLGGGEDAAQVFAIDWFARHPDLCRVLAGPAVTFAVCAGLQILGHSMTDTRGTRHDGLGLLDLSTTPARRRAVGEVVARCEIPGVGLLTGFANHRGATALGPGVRPLGRVLSGTGNDARSRRRSGVEGAVYGNVVATYLHGPVLARNPALADHLLHRATGLPFTTDPATDIPDLPSMRRTYLSHVR